MEFKDYYQTMGVSRDATQDEIKRAYRLLARKYHPDVSKLPDAEVRFKELGEAYAVLKDIEKRAAYDQLGSQWQAGEDFRPPPDWNAGFEFSGGGAGRESVDFSDFFESLYGHGMGREGQANQGMHLRGQDHHAKVMIDLEDSYTGATRMITLQKPGLDGQGRTVMQAHKLNVAIPRGIRSGQHIRLVGQGRPGMGQGKAGDLYLEIEFHTHAYYRVEQRDVYLDLPVAPWEAQLGATLQVPTPGGPVALKVPKGSNEKSKLRLKGRGIPGTTPGDFYAVLHIALPPASNDEATAFYQSMATQFATFKPRTQWEA